MEALSSIRTCAAVQWTNDQCISGGTTSTTDPFARVVAIQADCAQINSPTCTFVSAGVGAQTASAVVFRGLKGGVTNIFGGFPAVNVKAGSATAGEGASFFDFGMVIYGVAEWADANADNAPQLAELSHPVLFNDAGYAWTFTPSHSAGLWTITMTGAKAANPTVTVNCTIPDRQAQRVGAFTLDGNAVKCDIEITGLTLTTTTNGWAIRLLTVSGDSDVKVIGTAPNTSGTGSISVEGVSLSTSGRFDWARYWGRRRGEADLNVTFSGFTQAGTYFTGTGAIEAATALYGFPNPSPGNQFDVYWDPQITAPGADMANSAAHVVGSLGVLMALATTLFTL